MKQALQNFFLSYLKKSYRPAECFIIYIATELGDNDANANSLLESYLKELKEKFIPLLNTTIKYKDNSEVIANNLVLLFCNSMCYCHIQKEKESHNHITLNLDIILNN
ncbi:MAG: hypothetical protein HRT72_04880 [Flavobacteriales bacterium]|nr:hypothetical protein [Flavobacteriales bacterium]